MLLIGSRAAQILAPKEFPREPNDWDFILWDREYQEIHALNSYNDSNPHIVNSFSRDERRHVWIMNDGTRCEFYVVFDDDVDTSSYSLLETSGRAAFDWPEFSFTRPFKPEQLPFRTQTTKVYVPSLSTLGLIKRSHAYFMKDYATWRKHMEDYHWIIATIDRRITSSCGFSIHEGVGQVCKDPLLSLRIKETEERIGKQRLPNMRVGVDKFFEQSKRSVDPLFVHDELHKVVAHDEGNPYYLNLLKDPTKVEVDIRKFMDLSPDDRRRCIQEEAYVIALERILIPVYIEGKNPKVNETIWNEIRDRWSSHYGVAATYNNMNAMIDCAIEWAIMRICTTLTTGWFRDYAIEIWPSLFDFEIDPWDRLVVAMQTKTIQPIRGY